MSLYRNFINVGAMTTGSRILGFVRDALLAVFEPQPQIAEAAPQRAAG